MAATATNIKNTTIKASPQENLVRLIDLDVLSKCDGDDNDDNWFIVDHKKLYEQGYSLLYNEKINQIYFESNEVLLYASDYILYLGNKIHKSVLNTFYSLQLCQNNFSPH